VLLQALIHEILEARDAIRPVFKLPVGSALLAGVRAPSRFGAPDFGAPWITEYEPRADHRGSFDQPPSHPVTGYRT